MSPIHPTCVCVCTGRKIEREEGSRVEEEEEGKLRSKREGEGREHKTPKVQSRLLPHTQLPLGTHQSWSREMRGNRCYSSPCLTAGSRLATPSARRGAKEEQRGPIMCHVQLLLASGCDIKLDRLTVCACKGIAKHVSSWRSHTRAHTPPVPDPALGQR